ncbi:hypothetical protein B0H10DRAFT_2194368 [Mycena sp. CBHHK59/15]|nr:hypothetical protein B0H10DRAFT_2194368 [Mycena sp. CBHHK59/15]
MRPSTLRGLDHSGTSPPSETASLVDSTIKTDPESRTSWRDKIHYPPASRPWRSPQRSHRPSHLESDRQRTRLRVKQAVQSILQVAGDQVLPVAAEALSTVPIPGVAAAAKILDNMWKSIQLVQTNVAACLRLIDRCADLLLTIHEAVSHSGDVVIDEMKAPMEKLAQSFSKVDRFLKDQAEQSFLNRYLRRDEILREISECNVSVGDCLYLFNITTQMLILKGVLRLNPASAAPSMLLGPASTPPLPFSSPSAVEEDLDALNLNNFPAESLSDDDVSSLSEKLRCVQETQNERDRASDTEHLRHLLTKAFTAPNYLAVTNILQIAQPDMPAAIMILLRELEKHQNTSAILPSESPSRRIRALTWPLDGLPAKQVALLDRQFIESELEALKKLAWPSSIPPTPSLISGTFERIRPEINIQIFPSAQSDDSVTSLATPNTPSQLGARPFSNETKFLSATTSTADHDSVNDPLIFEPPSDPFETATELRYRMSLSHAFHHLALTLPLWKPSPVDLGAVGYLAKPEGEFRTLFNCCNPTETSNGRLSALPPLLDTMVSRHKQNPNNMARKGMKIVDKLMNKSSEIKRTYSVSIFGETAHLIAEKAEYSYFSNHDAPKRWFRSHVHAILQAYPQEFLKEELFLVVGTLNARDYALFVNHQVEEELLETHFHVLSARKPGEPWGYFSKETQEDGSGLGPHAVFKVSDVGPDWNTVLLSRLRFRPDEQEPTSQ